MFARGLDVLPGCGRNQDNSPCLFTFCTLPFSIALKKPESVKQIKNRPPPNSPPLLGAILILQDTVQIRSRHGCHSFIYSDFEFRYSTDTLQTRMPFCHLFKFQLSDTVQIHSRHGSHSVTHSDLLFRYSMDNPQTRRSFYYSFRIQSKIQFGYAPDTDAILSLIQTSTIRYRLDML